MLFQLAKAVKTVSLSYRLLSSSVMLGTLVASLARRNKNKRARGLLEGPKDVN